MKEIIETLGLSWVSMLIYALNIAILVVVLYFLLYKPVQKSVKKRKDMYDAVYNENAKLNAEALTIKQNYEKMIEDTKQDVAKMSMEVLAAAESKKDELIEQAQRQAVEIISDARKEAEAEQKHLNAELKKHIGDMSIGIASKVLSREISLDDNKKIINEALNGWESQ